MEEVEYKRVSDKKKGNKRQAFSYSFYRKGVISFGTD